jgi:hypothetical protein
MDGEDVKVEIWDSDIMSGSCCGPVMMSQRSIQKIMDSINEKNRILERLRDEFKDVKFETDMVSLQRPMSSYPPHVSELLCNGVKAPMVFIAEKAVVEGKFPRYEEFKQIIEASKRKQSPDNKSKENC